VSGTIDAAAVGVAPWQAFRRRGARDHKDDLERLVDAEQRLAERLASAELEAQRMVAEATRTAQERERRSEEALQRELVEQRLAAEAALQTELTREREAAAARTAAFDGTPPAELDALAGRVLAALIERCDEGSEVNGDPPDDQGAARRPA
jgi:hypothetical protein